MEYADEPRLIFSPLTEQDYCKFYNLEMSCYVDDLSFYTALLHDKDHVLELGCGTGRLTRHLAKSCEHIKGIDRSGEMLKIADIKAPKNVSYQLMDMLQLSFRSPFDTIVIPYNTINLLGNRAKVEKCLKLCCRYLTPTGKLAFHAYHPSIAIKRTNESEKQFQFAIFDDQNGGRVVKETLKWFHKSSSTLNLEERYRVRPVSGCNEFRDLRHNLQLYTPDLSAWKLLLRKSGFSIKNTQGDANGKSFCADNDTSIFIHAEKV